MSKPAPKILIFYSSGVAGIAFLNLVFTWLSHLFFTERKLGPFLYLIKKTSYGGYRTDIEMKNRVVQPPVNTSTLCRQLTVSKII